MKSLSQNDKIVNIRLNLKDAVKKVTAYVLCNYYSTCSSFFQLIRIKITIISYLL